MSTPTTIFQFWVIALLASIIYILEAPYFSMFKPLRVPPSSLLPFLPVGDLTLESGEHER